MNAVRKVLRTAPDKEMSDEFSDGRAAALGVGIVEADAVGVVHPHAQNVHHEELHDLAHHRPRL